MNYEHPPTDNAWCPRDPAAPRPDRLRGLLMPPPGIVREMLIEELLEHTGEFMRLLDCHVEGFASIRPFVVLVGDKFPVEGNKEVNAEVALHAESTGEVAVLEHEVTLKLRFKGGNLKSSSLSYDGIPYWNFIAPKTKTEVPA